MSPDWLEYGYGGLFLGSFLAATLLPFPSEALLLGALELDMNMWGALALATLGNFLGGMTNYGIGYYANSDVVLARFKIDRRRILRWEKRSGRWGYWLGLMSWLPIVGDPMLVALGFLKTKFWSLCITVFVGKLIRYCVIIWLYFIAVGG